MQHCSHPYRQQTDSKTIAVLLNLAMSHTRQHSHFHSFRNTLTHTCTYAARTTHNKSYLFFSHNPKTQQEQYS